MEHQKRIPLLLPAPAPSKPKKEPKTYCFNLELGESNDRTYPEFSWRDLVSEADVKMLKEKSESGVPSLNPYASDDEDDLKAMAARFEAKYASSSTKKKSKSKLRAEDFIDKGAGYDETDSFIDNSDIYDEIVPIDLQPVHGGFYINSGVLDFKQVDVSEDDEETEVKKNEDNDTNENYKKGGLTTTTEGGSNNHAASVIQQVSHGISDGNGTVRSNRVPSISDIVRQKIAKRRASNSSGGSAKAKQCNKRIKIGRKQSNGSQKTSSSLSDFIKDNVRSRSRSPNTPKVRPETNSITPNSVVTSSSEETTTSETSDEEDSSCSNDSSDSTAESTHNEHHTEKGAGARELQRCILKPEQQIIKTTLEGPTNSGSNKNDAQPRKLKVKNVPLNPKLHCTPISPKNPNVLSVRTSDTPKSLSGRSSMPTLMQPQQSTSSLEVLAKEGYKDRNNSQSLRKPPTLTPAPVMLNKELAGSNNPPMKKLTNRMSCGPPAKALTTFMRKSEGNISRQIPSTSRTDSNPANSAHLQKHQKPPTHGKVIVFPSKKSTLPASQKIQSKIKIQQQKQKQQHQPTQLHQPKANEFLPEHDTQLNPKHNGPNIMTQGGLVTQAHQLLQQMQILASSSYNAFNRQSPVNSAPNNSGTNVTSIVPASRVKPSKSSPNLSVSTAPFVSSALSSQLKNLTQYSNSTITVTEVKEKLTPSRPASTLSLKSVSSNPKRNSSTPASSQASTCSLINSISLNSMNSIPNSKSQSSGKHITSFDVSALLSSNSRKEPSIRSPIVKQGSDDSSQKYK